jgi:hypothetical protein
MGKQNQESKGHKVCSQTWRMKHLWPLLFWSCLPIQVVWKECDWYVPKLVNFSQRYSSFFHYIHYNFQCIRCVHILRGWSTCGLDFGNEKIWTFSHLALIHLMKVTKLSQTRPTPFKDGILGNSQWYCFKHWHLELSIWLAEGLDVCRAHGFTNQTCNIFYQNLQTFYT